MKRTIVRTAYVRWLERRLCVTTRRMYQERVVRKQAENEARRLFGENDWLNAEVERLRFRLDETEAARPQRSTSRSHRIIGGLHFRLVYGPPAPGTFAESSRIAVVPTSARMQSEQSSVSSVKSLLLPERHSTIIHFLRR